MVLLAGGLLGGCGVGDDGASGGDERLEAARARWAAAEIEDYTWRFTRDCFCPPLSAEVRVADGEAVDVSRLTDPRGGGEVPELEFTTMEELFDLIERELGDAHEVTAAYDPTTGQVVRFATDQRADTVDDERGYEVTRFVPGDGGAGSTRVELAAVVTAPSAGVVEVQGTATVPEGSSVNWALQRADEPDRCPVDVPPEEDPCNAPYGSATVVHGAYAFRVDGVDPGEVEVFVAFDPTFGDQPVDVARRYGPLGRRMTGPQVVDFGGGMFRAQVTETITVR